MSADWTTARVVRDCDGDLWGRDRDGWNLLTDSVSFVGSITLGDTYGPLTPILDADGLPVVRTVGDLTARHLGREIAVDGMRPATMLAMRQPLPDQPLVALLVSVYGDGPVSTDYLPLDTPCEVLP